MTDLVSAVTPPGGGSDESEDDAIALVARAAQAINELEANVAALTAKVEASTRSLTVGQQQIAYAFERANKRSQDAYGKAEDATREMIQLRQDVLRVQGLLKRLEVRIEEGARTQARQFAKVMEGMAVLSGAISTNETNDAVRARWYQREQSEAVAVAEALGERLDKVREKLDSVHEDVDQIKVADRGWLAVGRAADRWIRANRGYFVTVLVGTIMGIGGALWHAYWPHVWAFLKKWAGV